MSAKYQVGDTVRTTNGNFSDLPEEGAVGVIRDYSEFYTPIYEVEFEDYPGEPGDPTWPFFEDEILEKVEVPDG